MQSDEERLRLGQWEVADPASRDQDVVPFRRLRFQERVRRAWNNVTTPEIESADDLEALARIVADRSGQDVHDVLHRLQWFEALEEEGAAPREDKMLRPGAPPVHRPVRWPYKGR